MTSPSPIHAEAAGGRRNDKKGIEVSNYIEEARRILEKKSDCHGSLLDLYTLLVFVKGKDVNWKDVHDAWAVWKNNEMPDHKSLIPYEALTLEVQELDKEYADAIAETAEELGLK